MTSRDSDHVISEVTPNCTGVTGRSARDGLTVHDFFLLNKFLNFRSGCEDRPDMERPKIQMMVNDGEEEELVELAAPSADAAIRLKLGDTLKKDS